MKFTKINAYRARAAHCSEQADLAIDAKIKQYWNDLADDWLAMDKSLSAIVDLTVRVIH
jgi:hypothetical protein